jgi:hypothetical protein
LQCWCWEGLHPAQRHASAIRRKITILGTRLDSLQSLLSKLPVKCKVSIQLVFILIKKGWCYYSSAMRTWTQCPVVIWCFLFWKMFCGILHIYPLTIFLWLYYETFVIILIRKYVINIRSVSSFELQRHVM